jgi:hypothetical protein
VARTARLCRPLSIPFLALSSSMTMSRHQCKRFFDVPMGAPDVVGELDRNVAAEQAIGRYGGGFASAFADAGDFGDRLQPRPLMLFL